MKKVFYLAVVCLMFSGCLTATYINQNGKRLSTSMAGNVTANGGVKVTKTAKNGDTISIEVGSVENKELDATKNLGEIAAKVIK